jgi:hypothetical protein
MYVSVVVIGALKVSYNHTELCKKERGLHAAELNFCVVL